MLMFLVYVKSDRYAIKTNNVLEVIPAVLLKKIPFSPHYISGILNYGGLPIPVIDLCQLLQKQDCSNCMHTRIILFKFNFSDKKSYHLGLRVEKLTETIDREASDFIDPQIHVEQAPFLDGISTDGHGTVTQMINDEKLFTALKNNLYDEAMELQL